MKEPFPRHSHFQHTDQQQKQRHGKNRIFGGTEGKHHNHREKREIKQRKNAQRPIDFLFPEPGKKKCKTACHDQHLHKHITGDSQIIGIRYFMDSADDAAEHQHMHKRMMGRKIPRRHLQIFILGVIDKKPRIYGEKNGKPAKQQKHKR